MRSKNFEVVKMKNILLKGVVLLFAIIMLSLSLISISGCSSKIISEKKVFQDIKAQDPYCSKFNFTYDSMKVVKRMTDEEKKTDNVYVNFKCHNNDFEYNAECIVNYVLYNEGWIFENYELLNSSYSALTQPTTETIFNDFSHLELENIVRNYGDEGSSGELDPNSCNFIADSKEKLSEYFSWDIINYISYEFTPEEGWVGKITFKDMYEIWNWDAFVGGWDIYLYESKVEGISVKQIDEEKVIFDFRFGDNIITETFQMQNRTGDSILGNHIEDFPIYDVNIDIYHIEDKDKDGTWNDEAFRGYNYICFTPYGVFDYVNENDGNIGFGEEYTKIS